MDMEHEDMIQMDKEIMIQKQDVLVCVAEKQNQVMIKEVLVEGIGAIIEETILDDYYGKDFKRLH